MTKFLHFSVFLIFISLFYVYTVKETIKFHQLVHPAQQLQHHPHPILDNSEGETHT